MKRGQHRRGSATSLALAALALAGCTAGGQTPAPPPTVTPPPAPTAIVAPPATAAEFDRRFIDMMVPHHEGAIEMAGVAQARAEHPELRQLAIEILRTQAAEVNQLRRWRQQWYGSSVTPPMSQMPILEAAPAAGAAPQTMNMAAEVVRLRSAPPPFDRAFIDAMIPHHQSAIEAARLAEQQPTRPEIKDLTRAIIDGQLREIDQLRRWRQEWYAGTDAPAGAPGGQPPQGPRDAADPHAGH